MLLSDKIELSWGGNAYKILTEFGDIFYVSQSVAIRELFFHPVNNEPAT